VGEEVIGSVIVMKEVGPPLQEEEEAEEEDLIPIDLTVQTEEIKEGILEEGREATLREVDRKTPEEVSTVGREDPPKTPEM